MGNRLFTARSGLLLALVLVSPLALTGCAAPGAQQEKLGISYYKRKQYQQAISALDQALAKDPLNARAQYYTGLAYMRLHDYEQAEYHLKTSWTAFPAQKGLKNAIIKDMLRQGKTNEVLDFLERDAALTARTENPNTLAPLPRYRPVPASYIRAKRMYASRINDRLRVARLYQKLGDMDNAAVNYRIAAQIGAQHAGVLLECAKFFEKLGDKRQAAVYLRQAFKLNPNQPGLVSTMTRDGVYISNVVRMPRAAPPAPAKAAP